MTDPVTQNTPGSEWTPDDPCAYCRQLKEAWRNLISGKADAQIQYLAGGVTRMVAFAKGNTASLEKEIAKAEADCAALGGLPSPRRRFAIQGGSIAPDETFPFRRS